MQPGDLLRGRFEIGPVVREGGMGAVFRARDREGGAVVAVKTLLEASPASVERFEREAALLASLRHPAVVAYVDHGVFAGEPYLVMEWLEGEELTDRLVRGPLSEEETRAVAVRLAEALGAAHALGVVHRDVKPSNVVLVDNEVARATLIDFGVALAGGPRRTRTGLVVGTPGYMAPEQARASRAIDARADVYALGCVIFECLTGKPPFTGEHPVAILAKVLLEDAPRLRSIAPSTPGDLDVLVDRMLAKDPEKRPRDGNEVAEALRREAPRVSSHAPSVMPEALGEDERVVVHVILAARPAESGDVGRTIADDPRESARAIEARIGIAVEIMADGSVVATLKPGALGPKGGAMRAATAARELAREMGVPVVLASGFETIRRGLPLGEILDRAAALARAGERAGPGSVVVDEVTTALLRGAWNVVAKGGVSVLEAAPVRARDARPMVGRDRELGTLDSLYEEVESEGVSRVAIVSAPPGGGKTRLLEAALERWASRDDGARVLAARCDETASGASLAVAAEIARLACGASAGDSPEALRDRLSAVAASSSLAADAKRRVLDFVGEMIGAKAVPSLELLAARTDAMTMSDQTQRAFVDLLRVACEGAPLVVCVDDAQWCDRASFRLLEVAARELEAEPLFVLALARPDFDEAFPTAFAERALTRLALPALGKRAAESLARDVAGEGAADEVIAEVVTRGEGNPFMLEELARGVREGRPLGAVGGTTALVAARFEALSVEARRALRAASIVGQQFSRAAVAALLACDPDAPWLASTWSDLERAEIVAPSGEELAFRHALLRDAAYATLTTEDRALGHKLAARFFDGAAHADPMIVAAHASAGGDVELAARAYVDAAQRALEASDFAGAVERAKSAGASGAAGDLLARAERIATEACLWLGSLREVLEHAQRAMSASSGADFFVAGGCRVTAHAWLGEADDALAVTKKLLASTATTPNASAARANALLQATSQLAVAGQLDLAKALLRETKPVVSELATSYPLLPARYARSRSIVAMASGDLGAHVDGAREAADLYASLGDRRNDVMQRMVVAYGEMELGDFAASVNDASRVISEATAMGLRSVVAMTKQNAGYALCCDGKVDEGLRMLDEALTESAAQGHARMTGGVHLYVAIVRAENGDGEGALAAIEKALEQLATTPPARAHALAVLARIRLDRGELAEGKRAADEALAVLDSLGGIDSGESDVYLAAARARLAAGEDTSARAVLRRGRDRILARAARLDEAQRATFLEKVAANVALLRLASETLDASPR